MENTEGFLCLSHEMQQFFQSIFDLLQKIQRGSDYSQTQPLDDQLLPEEIELTRETYQALLNSFPINIFGVYSQVLLDQLRNISESQTRRIREERFLIFSETWNRFTKYLDSEKKFHLMSY